MNIEQILAILQEIAKILQALQALGIKLDGTVNVPDLVSLFKPKT